MTLATRRVKPVLLFSIALLLGACGGGGGGGGHEGTPSGSNVSVAVSPAFVTLSFGESRALTATVKGTTNTGVSWTTTGGTVTSSGVYTAPATAGTYTVTARSLADSSKSAASKVTVKAPALLVSPSRAEMLVGGTLTFSASGAASAGGVTWSATAGTITSAGIYTAPMSTGTFIVTASGGGQTTSASVAIVNPRVSVSPASKKVLVGSKTTFTAAVSGITNQGVTWTALRGTITAAGEYTAPAFGTTDTITATSKAYGSVKGTATVQVAPSGTVVVMPTEVTMHYHYDLNLGRIVYQPETYDFSVALTGGLVGEGVTWDMIPTPPTGLGGSIDQNGHYVPFQESGTPDPPGIDGNYTTVRATSKFDPSRSATAKIYFVKTG